MDYVSALNGQQMDEALTDVALRNSEAWAVGKRNGRNVTSADETWHNNAKYYAQVAQSAIPGTYTAAVRWDIDQGLAGEAQEQARANISAGASNRNLLDNPFFTVNQRNFTSVNYTSATTPAYCVDRWLFGGVGSLTYNSDKSLTVNITSGNYGGITQRFDPMYKGLNVTISIRLTNGTVVSTNGKIPSASGLNRYYIALNGSTWEVLLRSDGSTWWIELRCNVSGATATIRAVKLELGSYSTLANDVPPDYGEELRKCKYYFERVKAAGNTVSLGIGYNDGYNTMYGVMKIEPKRVTPSLSGSSLLIGTTSLNTTSSSKSIYSFGSDGTAVIQIVATNAFSTNQPYRFGLPSNGYIDFSADL